MHLIHRSLIPWSSVMKTKQIAKKRYMAPEMTVYGNVPAITREATNGGSLDAPILAGMTFADATFS